MRSGPCGIKVISDPELMCLVSGTSKPRIQRRGHGAGWWSEEASWRRRRAQGWKNRKGMRATCTEQVWVVSQPHGLQVRRPGLFEKKPSGQVSWALVPVR